MALVLSFMAKKGRWNPRTDTVSRLGRTVRCGFYHKAAGHHRTRRTAGLDEYQLSCLMLGEGWYSDRFRRVRILPGMVYQQVPGEPHEVEYETDLPMFHFSLVLPSGVYQTLQSLGALSPDRPVFAIGLHPELVAAVEKIITALRHEPDSTLHRVVVRMETLISKILDLDEETVPQRSRVVEEACVRLSRDFDAAMPLPDLARELGLSYSAFRKLFLQETGQSPGAYRIQRRLEYAQDLLSHSSYSIKEIARAAGYPDVYAFSKQFRKHVGLPPGAFAGEASGVEVSTFLGTSADASRRP